MRTAPAPAATIYDNGLNSSFVIQPHPLPLTPLNHPTPSPYYNEYGPRPGGYYNNGFNNGYYNDGFSHSVQRPVVSQPGINIGLPGLLGGISIPLGKHRKLLADNSADASAAAAKAQAAETTNNAEAAKVCGLCVVCCVLSV